MRAIVMLALLSFTLPAAEKVVGNAVPPAAQVVPAAPGSLVTLNGPHEARWQLGDTVPSGFWPDGPVCQLTAGSGKVTVLMIAPNEIKRYSVDFTGTAPPPGPMPGPTPPGPAPADPLKAKLAAAATKDGAAKADVLKLASRYTAAADAVKRPDVKTAGDLIDAMKAVNPMPGKLIETQRVIAAELLALLKDLKAPLTDPSRDATAKLFTAAAAILEVLGK